VGDRADGAAGQAGVAEPAAGKREALIQDVLAISWETSVPSASLISCFANQFDSRSFTVVDPGYVVD
jgi:hypothetical protein